MTKTSCEIIKLKNGLPVLLLPAGKESRTASLFFIARSGSEREDKNIKGAAHILEHMSFKGSNKYPQPLDISSALDSLGAGYNAYTSRENTVYYTSVAPSFLPQAISVLANMYSQPVLPAPELEKEKGVILEELRMYKDFPPDLAEDLLWPLMYGQDISAGWDIIGEEKTIKNMTVANLRNFHKKNYAIKNSAVIIAGRFDTKKVLDLLEQETNSFHSGNKLPALKKIDSLTGCRIKSLNKKTDQAHFVSAWPAFAYSAQEIPVAVVLATILGGGMSSRLFIKLREELGVAYYCFARHYALTNRGLFMLGGGLRRDGLQDSLSAVLGEVAKMKDKLVTDSELAKVKNILRGRLLLGLETPAGLASFFIARLSAGLPLLPPEEYLAQLEGVSARQIKNLSQKVFDSNNLNLTIVGDNIKTAGIKKAAQKILD